MEKPSITTDCFIVIEECYCVNVYVNMCVVYLPNSRRSAYNYMEIDPIIG